MYNVYVLFALKDKGGYWQLRVNNETVGTFFWNQIHFRGNFESLEIKLGLFAPRPFILLLELRRLHFKLLNLLFKSIDLFFHIMYFLILLFLGGLIINNLSRLFIFLGHDSLFLEFLRINHDNNFSIVTRKNYIFRICHSDVSGVD